MSINRYTHPMATLQVAVETNDIQLANTLSFTNLSETMLEQALEAATRPGRWQILQFLLDQPEINKIKLNSSLQLKIAVATNDIHLLEKIPLDLLSQAEKQDALNNSTALGRFEVFVIWLTIERLYPLI